MYEYARDDYKNLPELIDFSKYKSVMDIGGGYGAIIQNIKLKNPQLECILFDLPEVIQNVNIQGVTAIGGSFFEKIPVQADAVILSRVIHDWNDHKANIILQNCYRVLYKNGTLYIIENCLDNTSIDLSLLSLNMTVICGSHERTSTEYIQLAQNVGFEYKNQTKLNELQTILIFQK